ncbi:MAG: DUF3224 domain-containing protein [Phycisphaerales bacterium]|nr:DUF3224 domain-containing protein [Phycisphaerales bacterium]
MAANAFFKTVKWEDTTYDEVDEGPSLARANVIKAYEGSIEGEGTLEMMMMCRSDGSASFVGMERVKGRVEGRQGSFVFLHRGTFEAGQVKATWEVVPGSGTDDLRALQGKVVFEHGHAERYPVSFDCCFEG